jgi:hypothetical protein
MASTLENKLEALIHEIRDIKKEVILDKIAKVSVAKGSIRAWEALGKKVSAQWDGVSATEEIIRQREKTW